LKFQPRSRKKLRNCLVSLVARLALRGLAGRSATSPTTLCDGGTSRAARRVCSQREQTYPKTTKLQCVASRPTKLDITKNRPAMSQNKDNCIIF
jgi:hypothetical protein